MPSKTHAPLTGVRHSSFLIEHSAIRLAWPTESAVVTFGMRGLAGALAFVSRIGKADLSFYNRGEVNGSG